MSRCHFDSAAGREPRPRDHHDRAPLVDVEALGRRRPLVRARRRRGRPAVGATSRDRRRTCPRECVRSTSWSTITRWPRSSSARSEPHTNGLTSARQPSAAMAQTFARKLRGGGDAVVVAVTGDEGDRPTAHVADDGCLRRRTVRRLDRDGSEVVEELVEAGAAEHSDVDAECSREGTSSTGGQVSWIGRRYHRGSMGEPELTLRRAAPEDRDEIIELCRASLGWKEGDPNEGFFSWKHDENPFGRSPSWVAVSSAGDLVGLRAFLRWRFVDTTGRPVEAVPSTPRPTRRGRARTSHAPHHRGVARPDRRRHRRRLQHAQRQEPSGLPEDGMAGRGPRPRRDTPRVDHVVGPAGPGADPGRHVERTVWHRCRRPRPLRGRRCGRSTPRPHRSSGGDRHGTIARVPDRPIRFGPLRYRVALVGGSIEDGIVVFRLRRPRLCARVHGVRGARAPGPERGEGVRRDPARHPRRLPAPGRGRRGAGARRSQRGWCRSTGWAPSSPGDRYVGRASRRWRTSTCRWATSSSSEAGSRRIVA